MKKINHIAFSIIIILILFYGCDSPEKSFNNALSTRQEEDFQEVIKKYPNSKFSKLASEKLKDIEYWMNIDSSLQIIDYKNYLDSIPSGLFIEEAKYYINEIKNFEIAQDADIIKAYSKFEEKYPTSLFDKKINERIEFLEPVFKGFQILKGSQDISTLKSFAKEYQETGYGRIITSQLDSIFLKKAEEEVLSMNQYEELPKNIGSLVVLIKTTKDIQKSNLAKQAYEEILVKLYQNKESGFNYIIPDIIVVPSNLLLKYSIRKSLNSNEVRAELTKALFKNVTMSGTLITDQIKDKTYLFFTENDYDLIPDILSSPFSTALIVGLKGKLTRLSFSNENYYENTVWRFYGKNQILEDYEIISGEEESLCFILKSGIGAVYLYGKGTVLYKGVETKLGY